MTVSASGVRIQGDDYQHLFAWQQVLRMLRPGQGVVAVEVEAPNAGNVDDVVVRRNGGADEYYQVKFSVDATHPIDHDWWIDRGTAATSPLEKFWASWKLLSTGGVKPRFALLTNRALDTTDPLLQLRDGRDGTLTPRAGQVKPKSDAGKRLDVWAGHLQAPLADVLEMLGHLQIRTEYGAHTTLLEAVSAAMWGAGLRFDEVAAAEGVSIVREWVATGVRRVDRAHLDAAITHRRLLAAPDVASVVIEGIDSWVGTQDASATYTTRWVERFEGTCADDRRRLKDPADWNGKLLPDLQKALTDVQRTRATHVRVNAWMRLAPWFAFGSVFSDRRNLVVTTQQRGVTWSTDVAPGACSVAVEEERLGDGAEVAVVLSVTRDIASAVKAYVVKDVPAVGRLLHVRVLPEPSPRAFPDAAAAMRWAITVRDAVSRHEAAASAPKLHLFQCGPAGAALFLGHIWNRVPSTLLYEDANPGYLPTIFLAR
jgi:hypothetical protein